MKKNEKLFTKLGPRLAFLALLFLSFSCTQDMTELENNLEKKNGKSNTADLKTLVRGASLNAANGIAIGPDDGHLYVASVTGQEIVVMNKRNGKIIDRITEGVQSPDDLVFGPDGSLYWTDILTGQVGRRTPSGVVTKQEFLPGVNPIAFNDEGRLFIALDFQGDGLYEFDPELDPNKTRPIVECAFPLDPNPCLGFFNSFDFGPDGRLYGPLFAFNLIISVNVDPDNDPTSDPFNPSSDLDLKIVAGLNGEFSNPAAAKFGPDGLLYVLDQAGKVVKIDIENGNEIIPFTTLQPGLDNMVFDEDGSLYMTNNDEGWVAEILPNGQARIISPGGMIVPQGIAVMTGPNNQDMVFQADLFGMRQFNARSGKQEDKFRALLVAPPEGTFLTLPQNVSASGSDLIISSFFSSTVQVWNPESGVSDDFEDQVVAPIDAVRLNSGEVIVSEIGLVPMGGVISMKDNSMIQELFAASGLATDGESVWAADWGAGLIYKIDFGGASPDSNIVFAGLHGPEGLAIDNEGRLLVFETGGPFQTGDPRLSRIDFSSGTAERTTIVDGLEPKKGGIDGFPPMWLFDGVDVGSNGDIYLTGGEANVIHKIPQSKVK
ncbi:hypothetical protein [Lutimonas sp.]|uniref:hypothetical protein n=1 Tax=Lutimonas sp. TaxID=1872403 RepID=UPI003D9BC454